MSTLYQGWVVQHSREPRHHGPLPGATHQARCDNPLCGDRVTVQLRLQDDRIDEIRFQARSCAVATASASVLTELVTGLEVAAARVLIERARTAVHPDEPEPDPPLQHLAVVRGIRARRRCATLAWEALQQALDRPTEAA